MVRARLDKSPKDVAAMFDRVAARYDLVNELLSFGRARTWRRAVTRAIAPKAGMQILDCAAGTGSSTLPLVAAGAFAISSDFSIGMVEIGRQRQPNLVFVGADNLALPFADNSFDAITISFGLRNVADRELALREGLRVTKAGGSLLICEFSHPSNRLFRRLYFNYLMRALPVLARAFASNPDAYAYLAESIEKWPAQEELAREIERAGWRMVAWQNLTGGIVALHRGRKADLAEGG